MEEGKQGIISILKKHSLLTNEIIDDIKTKRSYAGLIISIETLANSIDINHPIQDELKQVIEPLNRGINTYLKEKSRQVSNPRHLAKRIVLRKGIEHTMNKNQIFDSDLLSLLRSAENLEDLKAVKTQVKEAVKKKKLENHEKRHAQKEINKKTEKQKFKKNRSVRVIYTPMGGAPGRR